MCIILLISSMIKAIHMKICGAHFVFSLCRTLFTSISEILPSFPRDLHSIVKV